MASVLGMLRTYAPYLFIAVGVAWGAIGAFTGSFLVAWPAVACVAGGVMLRQIPGHRLTWAWVVSTASMGLIVSVYQVYAWEPFLGGAFSTIAAASLAGFTVFALVHVLLFYVGASAARPVRSETS
ncbi:MAG: hypothetical protein JRM99_02160 [Nitrososphaerota archaeon]|nr:hypothetical protein [Nitrososphaerota archaeon]